MGILAKLGFGGPKYKRVAKSVLNKIGVPETPKNIRILTRRIFFINDVGKINPTQRLKKLIPELGNYFYQPRKIATDEKKAAPKKSKPQPPVQPPREEKPEVISRPEPVQPPQEERLGPAQLLQEEKVEEISEPPKRVPEIIHLYPRDVALSGVVTEPKLIGIAFPDSVPVCTDQFLSISKDFYPLPWLIREIVQNFVDENVFARGTLNGVTLEKINGQFKITGNWPFVDPTGLTSLHSGKASGTINLAGGNGIGIKQTVLRLLRDYDVQVFNVEGEGWIVRYELISAAEINKRLRQKGITDHQAQHEWLVATVKPSENRDKCAYIIGTRNHSVDRALSDFLNLGVSEENEFLQDLDFSNSYGAMKWLRSASAEMSNGQLFAMPKGRLFINGQIMNYGEKGSSVEDYWQGPEFVTLRLNDVKYEITLDRPAINKYGLERYIEDLISSMSTRDLIDQLDRSEYIWTNEMIAMLPSYSGVACLVVIKKIVDKLYWNSLYGNKNPELANNLKKIFKENRYLCLDSKIGISEIDMLRKQGYVICPDFFEKLGMPKARSVLDSFDAVKGEKPISPSYKMQRLAEQYGISVAFESLSYLKSSRDYVMALMREIRNKIVGIEARDIQQSIFRIFLDEEISRVVLFHPLPRPKDATQKLLYFYRGFVFHGLKQEWLKAAYLSQGEYVTTFGLDYDYVTEGYNLLARNVKSSSGLGLFIELEFNPEAGRHFQQLFLSDISYDKPGEVLETPARDDLKLVKKLEKVPVEQPRAPHLERDPKVIEKEVGVPAEEISRMQKLEGRISEIEEAIEQLDSLTPKPEHKESPTEDDPVSKYLAWRESGHFYGQAGMHAGYLTGTHLVEILESHDRADIAVIREMKTSDAIDDLTGELLKRLGLQTRLWDIINRLSLHEEQAMEDFELVLSPSQRQMTQLGLLRLYFHLSTGAALPNDLFIFRGTGRKAMNIDRKAIGLHESLFSVSFPETLRSFIHEVAHNEEMNHGLRFRHMLESLFVEVIQKLSEVGEKAMGEEMLSKEERLLLEIRKEWESLVG